uniref:Uncharacterized protein n=1 Tax=Araucaria cunninghamii TaxID=56994 RepID=A0A0D6QUI2_ARACU
MEAVKSQSQSKPRPLEKVLAMKGGNGDSSYAYNSAAQRKIVQTVKPILERLIYENTSLELLFGGGGVFRIADLGCGTGTNTLLVADTIVKALQCICTRNRNSTTEMPELQVYFSDLPSNDFNSLFRMLPPWRSGGGDADADKDTESHLKPLATKSYFAAAVSGSHFGRLFPRKSLHFCHSSTSLHWLSRVPEGVEDRGSPAWSGNRVYVSSEYKEAVGDAYFQQFDKDLTAFLQARAEEMIRGGCMFLYLVGRNPGADLVKEQGILGVISRHLEFAFEEMVNEGFIEREKWESFNIPWFGPSPQEVESIVEREKSFAIKSVRVLRGLTIHPMSQVKTGEEDMFGRMVANTYRALFDNIVEAHLGCDQLTNEFFSKVAQRAAANYLEYLPNTMDIVFALLLRK